MTDKPATSVETNTQLVTLVFNNADATPKRCAIRLDNALVPAVMAWYGAFHAGDRYTVTLDGRNVPMDQNGCPLG
jgi:hypothetical protein